MVRTLFIDIDGTLLNHDHRIPPSAATALKEALERGHRLVFCTGRNVPEVFPEYWDHGFSALVGGGGAYGITDGQVVFDHRIDRAHIDRTTDWLEAQNLPWLWQTPEFLWGTDAFWDSFTEPPESKDFDASRQSFLDNVRKYRRTGKPPDASKAVVILPTDSGVTFADFHNRFKDEFTVIAGSMSETFGQSVELVPVGVNKATGMFAMAEHLGVAREDIVGIGDSANDIEMIAQASLGIAMGNSVPEVIEVADWVSTDVAEDGLANALRYAGVIGDLKI